MVSNRNEGSEKEYQDNTFLDIFSTFEIYRIIKLFLSKLPKIVLPLGEVTQERNASFPSNTTE